MARPRQEKTRSSQVSVRLEPKDYEDFDKLAHLEFSRMATIARNLILEWISKRKKKLR